MKIVTNPTGRLVVVLVVIVAAIVTALFIKDWDALNGVEEPSETLLKSNVSDTRLNGLEGVSLEGGEYNLDNNSINFTLTNESNTAVYYGDSVILEIKLNNQWFEIPYSGDIGFLAVLNRLEPNKSVKISVPMEVWIDVSAGEYRVVLDVSNQERMKNVYPLSVSFTIE